MYVLLTRWHRHPVGTQHLYEMTRPQYWAKQHNATGYERYMHISAAEAHAYIRTGAVHSTSLYVDDTGRIRRARS